MPTSDRLAAERRSEAYAIKFDLDCGMDGCAPEGAEPTDDNLALNLGHCVRPPRPEEYPAIRRAVTAYRAGTLPA